MDMSKNMMAFAALMIGLFVIIVVVGLVYVGSDYMKKAVCEQSGTDTDEFTYKAGVCTNSTGTTQTITAISKIGKVEGSVNIALGLLSLVVLMLLFALVLKAAKQFGTNQS